MRALATLPAHRVGKWVVLGVWILIGAWAFANANKLADVENNNAAAFLPASAESTMVVDILEDVPGADATPASVVFIRDSGVTSADRAELEQMRTRIANAGLVEGNVSPVVASKDGKALLIQVPMNLTPPAPIVDNFNSLNRIAGTYNASDPSNSGHTTTNGLDIWVTGPAAQSAEMAAVSGNVDSTLLLVSGSVVILLLLLTYRSPVLWFFPLLCVGVSLMLARSVNYLLADHFGLIVNFASASILLVLVFGAGTDYALLLTSRYREELRIQADKHAAMATALRSAGPAIIASAATVSIGMLCLLVSTLGSDRGLGPVAAVGIICALACMLTLYPALLVIAGRWIFWPRAVAPGTVVDEANGVWYKIGHRVARRPRLVWITTGLVLLAVAGLNIPFLNPSGLTPAETFTKPIVAVEGQQQVANHFPAGATSPVYIAARPDSPITLVELYDVLKDKKDIETILDVPLSSDGWLVLPVALTVDPSSPEASTAIEGLRADVAKADDLTVLIGGATAINMDVQAATDRDRSVVIPLVLIVVMIVTAILLRAIVAAALLMLISVLSLAVALGVSVTLFHVVFGQTAQDSSYPLYVFIFLVALGVDYNIFLMHRVKEEAAVRGTREGILEGLAVTGGVITSAGLVLAATFASLAVLPITTTFQMGLTVAIGVLIDTFLVRTVLFPALGLDIGKRIWWPGKLSRQDDPPAPPADTPEQAPATVGS